MRDGSSVRSSDFPKVAQPVHSKAGINFWTLILLLGLPAASTSTSSQQSSKLPQGSSLKHKCELLVLKVWPVSAPSYLKQPHLYRSQFLGSP